MWKMKSAYIKLFRRHGSALRFAWPKRTVAAEV